MQKEVRFLLIINILFGGDFTTNIDAYGGEGTAVFVANAIEIYCDNAE